eukprot:15283-Heterococcus_DN1.PRE.1
MLRVISRVSAPVRQRASLATSAAEDTRSKEALRRFAANTPKNAAAARIASAIKAAQSATAQASVHNAAAASSATTAENTSSSSGTRIASSAEQTSGTAKLDTSIDYNAIWGDYIGYMEHQRDKGWKT